MLKHFITSMLAAQFLVFSMPLLNNAEAAVNNPHATRQNKKLTGEMNQISRAYDELGKQIDDPAKNVSSLRLVNTMIQASEKAAKQTPPGATAKAGDAKTEVTDKYAADMSTMLDHLGQMKTALTANKNAEARTHYDMLKPWSRPEHTQSYQ